MNKKLLSGIAAMLMTFSTAKADAIWSGPTSWNGNEIYAPTQVADNQKGLHKDPRWQMLGKEWGTNDGIAMFVDGNKIDLVNGVADINVGDEVTFEFNVHKVLWGVHTFDALKVWLDGEEFYADEWVFGETLNKPRTDRYHSTYSNYSDYVNAYQYDLFGKPQYFYNDNIIPRNGISLYHANADTTFSVTYTFEEAGEFDLLARVVCSSDLAGGHPGLNSKTYSENRDVFGINTQYTQGETEKFKIMVTSVPEPSMLILVGLSMLGISFVRPKRK